MKIFYSLDSLNEYLDNKCEFGQDAYIGSIKCQHCPYCYGAKTPKDFKEKYAIQYVRKHDYTYDKVCVIDNQYIKCSALYKKVPKSIKVKRVFYHLYIKFADAVYNIKKYLYLKFKK